MSTAIRAAKRWTTRLWEECRTPRCMPASEVVCRRCAPGGGPRFWRLVRLREKRLLQETPTDELAAAAGVSLATILRAECGRRVRTETAAKIAEALGTSIRQLAKTTERK